jgi:hypothetical protein
VLAQPNLGVRSTASRPRHPESHVDTFSTRRLAGAQATTLPEGDRQFGVVARSSSLDDGHNV